MKKIYLILGLVFGLQTIATAQLSCGETFLDSGGSAGDYGLNELDTITICPVSATDVATITFSSFDLEDGFDFMYIIDGDLTTGTLIGEYTGTANPGTITAENPSGCLTVIFFSDEIAVATGWEATIGCVPEPTCLRPSGIIGSGTENSMTFSWTANSGETSWGVEYGPVGFVPGTGTYEMTSSNPYTIIGLTALTSYDFYVYAKCSGIDSSSVLGPISFTTNGLPLTCGDMFTDSGAEIDTYGSDQNYTQVICPTTPGEIVVLTFSSFDTENNYDSLIIFDGNSTADPVVGIYQGTTIPGAIYSTNPNGCLTALFQSDGSVENDGWAAVVSCQAPITCFKPTNLTVDSNTDLTGTISWTSAGTETQWVVEYGAAGFALGSGTSVVASTNPYTISGLTELTDYDVYVRAFCGGTDTSFYSSVASFTTDMTPLAPFICGNLFTDAGGANGNYSNNTDDTIVICPTNSGDVVSLTFTEFQLEAIDVDGTVYDSLTFYDGNDISGTMIGSYAGANTPGTVIATNTTGCLTAVFISDVSGVELGWSATISCTTPVFTCATPTNPSASSITTTSVSLAWTNGGSEIGWIVEYGATGFTPGTGTMLPATTNPIAVNGLTVNTAYQFYVTAVCSLTDSSSMSTAGTFTTLQNTSGISENEINTLSIAPNPSTGKFVIKNTSSIKIEGQLFDAQGRKMNLYVNTIDANKEVVLDLNNFVNGVYFFQTSSVNGTNTYSLVKN